MSDLTSVTNINEDIPRDQGLKAALDKCALVAKEGYEIAKENNIELLKLIQESAENLDNIKKTAFSDDAKIPGYYNNFIKEVEEANQKLQLLHDDVQTDLQNQKSNLNLFNVVVYGRTKAGKSTLMETLTKGNGQSIGKGAQRTTLDVRGYKWNGLTVFDTPGIAASAEEGREDEKLAYHAAKYADLIIFLFSDDAPQQEEALAFSLLKKMGKPILGVINVKSSSSDRNYSKMRLRDIKKKLTLERLDLIKQQFLELASANGEACENVKFVYTDLHAAFLCNLKEPAELVAQAPELYSLSKFADVEQAIIDEVKNKGSFLQYKTFIDIIYKECLDVKDALITNGLNSGTVAEALNKNLDKLDRMRNRFIEDSQSKIQAFYKNLESDLRREIGWFAEDNYDNKYAGEDWNRLLQKKDIQGRCKRFLEGLGSDCENLLSEFTNEFKEQLTLSLRLNGTNIEGVKISNTLENLQSGIKIATALYAAATLNPVIAVGGFIVSKVFGLFGKSREDKIQDAIWDMEDALSDNIYSIMYKVRDNVDTAFKDGIVEGYLDKAVAQFKKMMLDMHRFEENHLVMAEKLNKELLYNCNINMILRALDTIGQEEYDIANVARIPGEVFLIEWNGDSTITKQNQEKLSALLQEKIIILSDLGDESYFCIEVASRILSLPEECFVYDDDKDIIEFTADCEESYNVCRCYKSLVEQIIGCAVKICPSQYNIDGKATLETESEFYMEWFDPEADFEDPVVQCEIATCYYYGKGIERNYEKAREWNEKSAAQGYYKGILNLGINYYFGNGCEENEEEAERLFKLAVEKTRAAAGKGESEAARSLWFCYWNEFGVECDKNEALKWLRKAAEQGNAKAQFDLGNILNREPDDISDIGDFCEANKWFTLAAEQGNVDAQFELAVNYYQGIGVKEDNDEAFKWFSKAAQQNHAEAWGYLFEMFLNGYGVKADLHKAQTCLMNSANAGDNYSMELLGRAYEDGAYGLNEDFSQAVYWYERAAHKDNLNAIQKLSYLYWAGKGVEPSQAKAYYWGKKAFGNFEEDEIEGYVWWILASIYQTGVQDETVGVDVEWDLNKAREYYHKAAQTGVEDAKALIRQYPWNSPELDLNDPETERCIGNNYYNGNGVEKNYNEMIRWYRYSASQNYGSGTYNLAWCYDNGYGVKKSNKLAQKYYKKAFELSREPAEQGDVKHQFVLGLCYHFGLGVEKSIWDAVEWYEKAAAQGHESAKKNLKSLKGNFYF